MKKSESELKKEKMPPKPVEQLKLFTECMESSQLVEGGFCYLLSFRWFTNWSKLTGFGGKEIQSKIKVGEIDNSRLLAGSEIFPNLSEHLDFITLPESAYKLLESWYKGGPAIKVPVKMDPETHNLVAVTVKWHLTVWYNEKKFTIDTDKYDSVVAVKGKACEHFNVDPTKARLVDYWNKNITKSLDDRKRLYQAHLISTQELLLECRNENGRWPMRNMLTTIPRTNSSMHSGFTPTEITKKTSGLVGFTNLGNTCYFNAALQCLVHTNILKSYFDSRKWRKDMNLENRTGTGGQLTNMFAQLEDDVWMKDVKVITPSNLKNLIGKYSKKFAGRNQEDSQELLMCFLDRLSGDLNKAKEKTYLEGIIGNGMNDNQVADTAWKRHKLIEDSAIVDIFHGQMKNEIVCEECGRKSVIFDPYASINVPIVEKDENIIRYVMIMFDPKKARSVVKIIVEGDDEFEQIKNDASDRFGIDFKHLLIMERDDITRDFKISLPPNFRKGEYFVFEIPDEYVQNNDSEEEEESKEKEKPLYILSNIVIQPKRSTTTILDGPLLIPCPDNEEDLENAVAERINYIWEESEFPTTDKHRAVEKKIVPNSANSWDPEKKFKVNLIYDFPISENDEQISCLSAQSIKISINANVAKEEEGFNWGALCPVDRTFDDTNPSNLNAKTLEECLYNLTREHDLDEFNQWFCPYCKKMVKGKSKLSIWSVPDILILQLNRFVNSGNDFKKVQTLVDFPFSIDLAEFTNGPQSESQGTDEFEYELYATINHMGILESGHYIANIYIDDKQEWYTFNDENVYPIPEEKIVSKSAYVLLYKRVGSTMTFSRFNSRACSRACSQLY